MPYPAVKEKMIIPPNAKRIIEILQHNSHDAYVVGGCVRDTLMGQIPGDWDITTDARPREVKKLFRRTIDTGIEHGTVTVLMSAEQPRHFESYEVTTYRIDGDYSDHRRPDRVEFSSSLHEDLRRRDFTINAMAYNDRRGLVDEFDGRGDLKRRIIRCVGNADERFEEDALRMLRAVRFAAKLGFDIEGSTLEAIKKHAPELVNVSAERIYTEIYKTITSPHPEKLQLIWDLGLAPYICPHFTEINNADGVLENRGYRTDQMQTPHRSPNTVCPSCETEDTCGRPAAVHLRYAPWAGLMRFISPDTARQILKELKSDNDTIRSTCFLAAEYKLSLPQTPYDIKKSLNRIGPELFDDLTELKRDQYTDEEIKKVRRIRENILAAGEPWRLGDLALNGHDIMEFGYRGKAVGEVLERLLDRAMADPLVNTPQQLTAIAKGWDNEQDIKN